MAKNTVVVSVLGDTAPLTKSFSTFGKVAAGVAVAAAAIGAAVATGIGVKAVQSASKLEQAMGGLQAVFKGAAPEMTKFAAAASNSVGLAQSDYAQLATVLGSQLKNMGVATDQLSGKTNELVGLGADLAAQFGGSTSDAVSALSSLLRGERDPIEKYGVSINEARLQAKLAEMGLAGLTGEALTQAKTQATLALLYEQTADAQGAFARESNTLAGQQERLRAGAENLYATLGTALLPAVTAVVGAIGALVSKIQESAAFAVFIEKLSAASTGFQDFVSGILDGTSRIDIGSLFTGLLNGAISGVTRTANWLASGGAQAMLDGLMAGRQALFDGALRVFPAILEALVTSIPMIINGVGIVVAQIVAFLADAAPIILGGAVQLFTGLLGALVIVVPELLTVLTGLLPQLVASILDMIGPILDAAVSLFTSLIDALPIILPELLATIIGLLPVLVLTILTLIPKLLTAAVQLFTSLITALPLILPNLLIKIVAMTPDIVRSVISMLPALLDAGIGLFTALVKAVPMIVTKLVPALIALGPQMVTTIQDMAPQLAAAGGDLIQGLVNGLTSRGARVAQTLLKIAKNAISGFTSFLGIRSPSRVFAGFGRNIGQGLANGMDGTQALLADAVGSMSSTVVDGFDATLSADSARISLSTSAAPAPTGNRYEITLQSVAPSAEIGRAILEAIRSYEQVVAV